MMLSPLLRSGVCLAATFVTSSVVGFGSAYADEPDSKARAQALFLEGRDAIDGGDWATGCPKIRASLELFVVANSHFTLAQCNERDGKLASALEHWERGLELVGPTDQRAGVAKEHIATLEPHVPRLRVIVPPVSGHAQVYLDDVELTAAVLSTPLRVDPGKHVLLVRAKGRLDNRTEISVIEAEKKEVMAYIGPPSDEESSGSGMNSRKLAGFVVGGLGVVSLAVSAGTAYGVKSADDKLGNCKGSACASGDVSSYKNMLVANAVTFGVGLAGVGAGLILIFTAPKPTTEKHIDVSFVPMAVSGGAGVGLSGRF